MSDSHLGYKVFYILDHIQTSKKSRKTITNVLINLDYDFLTKQILFKNVKINNNVVRCNYRGKNKLNNIFSNPIVSGDKVNVQLIDNHYFIIQV